MVERRDVEAALEARRELGPDYEPEIVDSLVEKVERRLAELRRPEAPAKSSSLAFWSLVLGIPITAIAGGEARLAGIVVVWIGIVLVNVANALRHR